jgi:D-aminoacyl-tRNA deacylase
MRVLIQRVKSASVTVDGEVRGSIDNGILALFSVHKDDDIKDTPWLAQKMANLRIFADEAGKMNLSVKDVGGGILVISQFTLYGSCDKGRRPDFLDTAEPVYAEKVYEKFSADVKKELGHVEQGVFGAYMEVELINDGPVTFLLER